MISYTINEQKSQISTVLLEGSAQCAVCRGKSAETEMTVGPYSASGELTFICNSHMRSSRQLINLLADYIIAERQRYGYKEDFNLTERVTPDAWFLH